MRIELRSNAVSSFVNQINNIESSISETIDTLKKQRNNIDSINGGHNNATRNASNNLAYRINKEIDKKNRAALIAKQTNAFINDTIAIDKDVASTVKINQKQFYKQYSWLKPQSAINGVLEDCKKWLKNTWKTVKEKLAKVWKSICDWVSDHWVELIVGTVMIIVGVVVTVFTGGMAAIPALLAAIKTVAISMAISSLIEGVISYATGDGFWKGFGDGLASGYMFGGILTGVTQSIAGMLKIMRRCGVGYEGLLRIGNIKFLSPNQLDNLNSGGTLINFGKNSIIMRVDAEAGKQLFHFHIPKTLYRKLPEFLKNQSWLISVTKRGKVHVRLIPILAPIFSHYYIKSNNE